MGVLQLRDYIHLQLEQTDDPEKRAYYQECRSVTFERKVGSRYFVSAANAGKILFMAPVAIEFLEYTGKCSGNKLEKSVYTKLKEFKELAYLKADAIMFHHVYAGGRLFFFFFHAGGRLFFYFFKGPSQLSRKKSVQIWRQLHNVHVY